MTASLRSFFASLLIALFGSACVVGAPPGFGDGDLWEVPLVAPLENDLLIVPVKIMGKGPFLFFVDPDSPESSISASIQDATGVFVSRAPMQRQTENDNLVRILIAEVPRMSIGDLEVRTQRFRVHDDGTYWSNGRRISGILGRDIIADSLIYSFDRDRGMMYIGKQGQIKPPPGDDVTAVSFTQSYSQHRRYLAKFKINRAHNVTMHMDLGARTSMLWPALISKFKLPNIPISAELVDEYGTKRRANQGTVAGFLENGKTQVNAITLLPYADKRLEPEDLDGIIGQNFFSKFNVIVNWHQKKFWLKPRDKNVAEKAKERLARWGDTLKDCQNPACVAVTLEGKVEPAAAPPPADGEPSEAGESEESEAPAASEAPGAETAPGMAPMAIKMAEPAPPVLALQLKREALGQKYAYDVLVAAVNDKGETLPLPAFLVSFEESIQGLRLDNLDPAYQAAAGFQVIDMSPIGLRGCDGSRCIHPVRLQ